MNRFDSAWTWLRAWVCVLALSLLTAAGASQAQNPATGRIDDGMLSSLRQIAQSLERSGQVDQALDLLIQYSQDLRVLELIQAICDKNGMQAQFLTLAAQAYSREPGKVEALVIYMQALSGVGLDDSLRACVGSFLAAAPPDADTYRQIARKYRSLGLMTQALALLEQGRRSLNAPALFRLEISDLLIDLGRYDRAIEESFALFEADRTNFPSLQRLLYRVLDSGDSGSRLVASELEKHFDKSGNELREQYGRLLLDVLLTRGEEQKAFPLLEKMAQGLNKPASFNLVAVFIGRALKLERWDIALQAYSLADRLELMGHDRVIYGQADIYGRMERYREQESALLALVHLEPASPLRNEALNRLGELYLGKLDQPGLALDCYRQFEAGNRERQEANWPARLKIMESFIHLDSLEAAEKLCDEMLAAPSLETANQAELFRLKADVMFFSGRLERADSLYKSFARLSLNRPATNEAIERAWLIRNDPSPKRQVTLLVAGALHDEAAGRLAEATGLFQQALEASTDSTCHIRVGNQMARMYERAGQYPLAAKVYEDLLAASPQHYLSAEVELRLAVILLERLGDSEAARSHLENIVLNRSEGVVTPEARRLLRSLEEPKL